MSNPWVKAAVLKVALSGSKMRVVGEEGPRRPGHCVYCQGMCRGLQPACESRVFVEAVLIRAGRRSA